MHPEEPAIPEKLKWPLAALWISLGLHGALIALVQVAPQPAARESVIEARLVSSPKAVAVPALVPRIEADDALAIAVPKLETQVAAEVLPVPVPEPVHESATAPESVETPHPRAELPHLEIPVAVDLNYYTAREVDEHPKSLLQIVPDYPEEADRQRVSGVVHLKLKIEESGIVSDIEIMDARPPGMFDRSAREAFRDARFTPAKKAGRPVRSLIVIEVQFDYEGRLVPGVIDSARNSVYRQKN
jgi:protein TonB